MEVDITGTMARPKENWQARTEKLCKPENFGVSIVTSHDLALDLSTSEYNRLFKKLRLIEQWASYMAAGMLKGTIKYEKDDWDIKRWMAHMIGEGADQANYQLLLFDRWRQDEAAKATLAIRSASSSG